MLETSTLLLYLSAAFVLAVTPGPGIVYVLTRSIKGGRREGYLSSVGTATGGMFHVFAATLGISAILATSALAFSIVKYAGAIYLIYIGIQMIRQHDDIDLSDQADASTQKAYSQGIITEMLNPKTAIFFLAFIPQFINPENSVALQFLILGSISILMNTTADFVVASLAGPIATKLKQQPALQKVQRYFSGLTMIGLGTYLAFSGSGDASH